MKDRTEFSTLTMAQVDEEIRLRRKMIDELVGWLYKSILSDDIDILRRRKQELDALLEQGKYR